MCSNYLLEKNWRLYCVPDASSLPLFPPLPPPVLWGGFPPRLGRENLGGNSGALNQGSQLAQRLSPSLSRAMPTRSRASASDAKTDAAPAGQKSKLEEEADLPIEEVMRRMKEAAEAEGDGDDDDDDEEDFESEGEEEDEEEGEEEEGEEEEEEEAEEKDEDESPKKKPKVA